MLSGMSLDLIVHDFSASLGSGFTQALMPSSAGVDVQTDLPSKPHPVPQQTWLLSSAFVHRRPPWDSHAAAALSCVAYLGRHSDA